MVLFIVFFVLMNYALWKCKSWPEIRCKSICHCGGCMQDERAVAECHEHISVIPGLQMLSRLDVRD